MDIELLEYLLRRIDFSAHKKKNVNAKISGLMNNNKNENSQLDLDMVAGGLHPDSLRDLPKSE